MRNLYLTAIALLLLQCTSSPKNQKNEGVNSKNRSELKDTSNENGAEAVPVNNEVHEDYETVFIVVLDTSDQFKKMYELAMSTSKKFSIPFDTFQKTYFPETNIWGGSLWSEDEIYRGEYFPRRNGSEKDMLSLEYQRWYDKSSRDKNLMLVTNIFNFSLDAEENIARWRPYFPKAFILQREIYMGCMH